MRARTPSLGVLVRLVALLPPHGGRRFPEGAEGAMMEIEMKLVASPAATEFVLAHGGRLWVWASSTVCCGGTRFIEASTSVPGDADRFLPLLAGDFAHH